MPTDKGVGTAWASIPVGVGAAVSVSEQTMKADRRHELKENELALALYNARDYLDRHGKQIGMAALAVIAVLATVTFAMRSRAAAAEDVWRRRSQLTFDSFETGKQSLQTLESITKELSEDSFVMGSLMDQGRQALRLAQQAALPPDRELNQKARRAFEELLSRFGKNPLALGMGLSGLATVEENEFVIDGNEAHKPKAREYLNRIVGETMLNGMPYQKMAVDRLASLDATFTKVTVQPPPPPPAPPPAPPPPAEGTGEPPKIESLEKP